MYTYSIRLRSKETNNQRVMCSDLLYHITIGAANNGNMNHISSRVDPVAKITQLREKDNRMTKLILMYARGEYV